MSERSLEFHRRGDGITYRIVPGQTSRVGRHASNDWVVADNSVSRFHARLEWGRDDPWPRVIDLDSANGTFVKGVRLPPQGTNRLQSGFTLKLGTIEFEVRARSGEDGPALLSDSSSSVELMGEQGVRINGRFSDWDDAVRLLLLLEDERRTGSLRVDLPGGKAEVTVMMGDLIIDRARGVELLRRLEEHAGGTYYAFSSKLKIGSQEIRGWKPNELLGILRGGDEHPTSSFFGI